MPLLLLLTLLVTSIPCYANKPELVVPTGHSATVTSIAFSPDGRVLASGSFDRTIKLWDVSSGKEIGALPGHDGEVFSIAWSPDGRTLASGGNDSMVKLWSVSERRALRKIETRGSVSSVAFSPDGRTLAAGGFGSPSLWGAQSGRALRKLVDPPSRPARFDSGDIIECVAWSPDGSTLAVGTDGNNIKLWEAASRKELPTLDAQRKRIASLAFNPDGKTLVAGTTDGVIRVWSVPQGKLLRTISAHKGPLRALAFSPNGKTLASGGYDDVIKLWDTGSWDEQRTFPVSSRSSLALSFSPDGKTLAAVDHKTIKLWELDSGKEPTTLDAHSNAVFNVICSPDGKSLASANDDHTVRIWALDSGPPVRCLATYDKDNKFVAFSPDGKTLAAQGRTFRKPPEVNSNTIQLLDIGSGKELEKFSDSDWNHPIIWSPDGKMLAATLDRVLNIYDAGSAKRLHTQTGCASYTWSPNGKMLALGTNNGTLDLWDVASWRKSQSVVGYPGVFSCNGKREPTRGIVELISWSPDGNTLATEYGGEIKLWDSRTCKNIRTVTNSRFGKRPMYGAAALRADDGTDVFSASEYSSLAFSPDGGLLLSADKDGKSSIQLRDTASGKLLRILRGHTKSVIAASFTPSGKMIVSASFDKTIRLWDTASGTELARLFSFGSNDWVVVTPDGHFDASPGAMKMLYWRDGNQIVESDDLKKQFYVPGLLQKAIETLG